MNVGPGGSAANISIGGKKQAGHLNPNNHKHITTQTGLINSPLEQKIRSTHSLPRHASNDDAESLYSGENCSKDELGDCINYLESWPNPVDRGGDESAGPVERRGPRIERDLGVDRPVVLLPTGASGFIRRRRRNRRKGKVSVSITIALA